MPINESQLAAKITAALNEESQQEINPAEARVRIGEKLAAAFAQFVQGRTTTVTGTSVSGGAVTGTGIIQ